jgi:electron transfer flavoprotein beta subunit
MHVVVFTRSTPDTAAAVTVGADGGVTWSGENVVNPWDEYALAEAVAQVEKHGGKATVIAVGGAMHESALRHSLAIGFHEALRIDADEAVLTDSLTYARLAAAALQKLGDVDLVIAGKESVDFGSDAHTVQTARRLGWTYLSAVSKIVALDAAARTITVERMLEQGKQTVSAGLPAVLSVLKDINEPRYPLLMGIRKANKATIPVWTAADLGIELPAPHTQVSAYANPPKREIQVEMIDGTPEEMAAKLVDRLIEEKVL